MTSLVKAFGANEVGVTVAPLTISRREPRPDDVVIDILYCGVCHSDLHTVRNHWNLTSYPVVPGHEIIGRVRETGSAVRRFKKGDLVGVGCLVDSCRHCAPCHDGQEQYCVTFPTLTYGGRDRHDGTVTHGGYSETIVVSEAFIVKVPSALDEKTVAPLLCAGITTYSPLRHWKVGPGQKVGIIGLGGLGHIGLKLAKAMGAEVTLITRNPGKEQEARRLGADHVLISGDPQAMGAAAGSFDLIIDTVPDAHDLNPYLVTLALNGTLVLVGHVGPLDPPVHSALLVSGRKAVVGSMTGGIRETQEMLDFCAAKGVTCDVELIKMAEINTAYERLDRSDVRYRFVIDMTSLKAAWK